MLLEKKEKILLSSKSFMMDVETNVADTVAHRHMPMNLQVHFY